jgi:hypothetical protein
MIIKEAVYAKKRKTVNVRISEEQYGCDCCRKKMAMDESTLRLNVFQTLPDGSTPPSQQLDFCSWKCVLKYLPKIKSNYFVCLPYLHYDDKTPGTRAIDFINLIKPKK